MGEEGESERIGGRKADMKRKKALKTQSLSLPSPPGTDEQVEGMLSTVSLKLLFYVFIKINVGQREKKYLKRWNESMKRTEA